jgi:UDP-GlcNAc:undecaprenyl-phosphate GlcNAc-1-phosphate transferase
MALYASLFLLSLVISLCLTPAVRAVARWGGVLDIPDGRRKLHPEPVPKLGGVAVFIAFYVCLGLAAWQLESPSARAAFDLAAAMFVPSLLILALGIVDDKWSVGPWIKIAVQIGAGLIVYYELGIRVDSVTTVFIGDTPLLGLLSLPLTLFWIVLITNAFNVVDGMDGLATGVAFIALACMFMVSMEMGQPAIALAAAPLAGAVLGFLWYNYNPASIFLGDSGSLFLGFQLAVLSIVGSQKSSTAVALTAPIFVLALPLIETATSIVRRFVSGRSIMQADARHIHHQLMRLGCTPRRAAGILYLGSGAFGLVSLFVIQSGSADIGLIALLSFGVTALAIQRLGYTEFAEINGALGRFVHQRRIIRNGIICRTLASDLAGAPSMDQAWPILEEAARRLGFSYVELRLTPRPPGVKKAARRYSRRLLPRRPRDGHEMTFAVALSGKAGKTGQVVFSRSAMAAPLHSELPLLISAVAQNLPAVIDRDVETAGAPICRAEPLPAPAPAPDFPRLTRSPGRMACGACGSPDLHRSRSRSLFEQLRKRLTSRRPYECRSCGWRGWGRWASAARDHARFAIAAESPDLRPLDLALQNSRAFQG